jgi:UDP-N-acetylglucosamine 2-epimerase (non-hydrolysing)
VNDIIHDLNTKPPIRISVVFGTRPEAIKLAPVIITLRKEPGFQVNTIVTGQHREMLDQVLRRFGLHPQYDLDIMTPGQNLAEITSRILLGLTPILQSEKPDLLMVHGDTTTTFASSLAAFYQKVPVAHVEAGLRTGDKWQPYPEELNRILTGNITDLHFAPTHQARENLLRENIQPESIFVTGNTVIDALYHCLPEDYHMRSPHVDRGESERLILVTAHRRENWGRPLENIIEALRGILMDNPNVRMLIPVHLNPSVQKLFRESLGAEPRISLVEPFDYQQMVEAMAKAYLIITDSGGIQEEAPALGKPVLVLRNKTERPEAIQAGTVRLVGTETENIRQATNLLLQDHLEYQKMAYATNPYGDGKASARIVAGLKYRFGLITARPVDFTT